MPKSLLWSVLFLSCLSACVVTNHARIDMTLANEPTMPFVTGSQVTIVCVGSNISQTNVGLRLLHDNSTLCSMCETAPPNFMLTDNIRVTFFYSTSDQFYFFITFDDLTEKDNGRYTCQASEDNSANVDILVAELACESSVENGRLDFKVGEILELTCHNPFQYSVGWFEEGSMLVSRTVNISTNLELTTAKIPLRLDDDSVSFECAVIDNAATGNSPKPCIIGPIRVSPFIEITSSSGNKIDVSTDSVTLDCRVFPENNETLYEWTIDSSTDYREDFDQVEANSSVNVESRLTLSNLSLTVDDVLNVSCDGFFQNSSLTTHYEIRVIKPDVKPDVNFFMIIIIASSAVALLIAIIILCFALRCLVSRFQRKTLTFASMSYPEKGEKESKMEHSGIILNKYEKGPTEFAGNDLAGNDMATENEMPTILTQLPDGRLQLQERKMSVDSIDSHGSTFSDVSSRSVETSMSRDGYGEPQNREFVDTASLQEIYDEAPTRESWHADNVPRPVSILLPGEHNTPSFREPASKRPLTIARRGALSRETSDSLPHTSAVQQTDFSPSADTTDENVYHDLPVDGGLYYEDEPIYSSVKKQNASMEIDEPRTEADRYTESFYDECEEEDYAAISPRMC